MEIKFKTPVIVTIALSMLVGCNVGMSPSGPSEDQIRKEIAAMPPEKQIKLIRGSPMSPKEKEQKIAEIEQKYGIKESAPAQTGPPGVPGAGP
jgi:hypothetical protein